MDERLHASQWIAEVTGNITTILQLMSVASHTPRFARYWRRALGLVAIRSEPRAAMRSATKRRREDALRQVAEIFRAICCFLLALVFCSLLDPAPPSP